MEVTWNNNDMLTVNASATGVQSVAEAGTTSVDACDCAALGVVVPVDLVKFQIRLEGKSTLLDWATANEINNAGFEIQRSTDGKEFRKIGWLKGQGNTSEQIDYSFVDDNMQSNVQYYYRLKQMDFDGQYDYSKVVTSIYKDIKGFVLERISPNPSESGHNTVRLLSTKDQDLEITVVDHMGKLYITKSISIREGINFYKLNVNELSAGSYFIKVTNGDQSNYKNLVVH